MLGAVQLGNEPGHWLSNNPGKAPTAAEHGKDFLQLKTLLASIFSDATSGKSAQGKQEVAAGSSGSTAATAAAAVAPRIQGPDVCFGRGIPIPAAKSGGDKCANFSYFEELLVASDCSIDEITVHAYGLENSKNASLSQCAVSEFLSPWVWEAAMAAPLEGWAVRQRVRLSIPPLAPPAL